MRGPIITGAAILALAALVLAGCTSFEKVQNSQFRQVADNGYVMKVLYNAASPSWGTSSEPQRLAWVAQDLNDRHACPSGYDIIDRDEQLYSSAAQSRLMEVTYHIACRA